MMVIKAKSKKGANTRGQSVITPASAGKQRSAGAKALVKSRVVSPGFVAKKR